jgi:hypothetical protein
VKLQHWRGVPGILPLCAALVLVFVFGSAHKKTPGI